MTGSLLIFLTWTLRKTGALIYHAGLARLVIGLTSGRLRTVLYHACESEEGSFIRDLNVNVTPATFERHLIYYKQYYNVISVNDVEEGVGEPNSLLITFDDGYASVHDNALPLLRQYDCPAVIYLIGHVVDNRTLVWVNRVNWALHHHADAMRRMLGDLPELAGCRSPLGIMQALIRRVSPAKIKDLIVRMQNEFSCDEASDLYLSTAQIMDMKRVGMSFGFHTNEHFNLANCTTQELETELARSDLDPLVDCRSFAYPFGLFDESAIEAVSDQDYETIMTVGIGNHRTCGKHVDRIEVFAEQPAELFAELEIVEPVLGLMKGCWQELRTWLPTPSFGAGK